MATQYFTVEGITEYAQVTKGFEAVKFDYNKTPREELTLEQMELKLTLEMDEENLEVFQKSGSRKKVKDGSKVEFVRDPSREFGGKEDGYPLVVLGEDGREQYKGSIGNGSRVSVFFSVYDSKAGKGTRLEGVRILDLVEYDPEAGLFDDESKELPF